MYDLIAPFIPMLVTGIAAVIAFFSFKANTEWKAEAKRQAKEIEDLRNEKDKEIERIQQNAKLREDFMRMSDSELSAELLKYARDSNAKNQ